MSIMSIIITIVSNITVLVSQNIFFGYFMPMSHSVNKKTPPSASPNLPLSPSRFSSGLFVVWQEMLDQLSIVVIRLLARDNAFSKKIRCFLLAHCWLVLILLFCLYVFYGNFLQFCHYEMTNEKLLLLFLVFKETKFEVDTTSIILSY